MRVKPLKATGGSVSGLVRYYEGKAADAAGAGRAVGYYVDTDEPPGRWWGSGCAAVGLRGEVVTGQLGNMFEAAHPMTGGRLGRGYGANSVRGFDATFSAPKSVSVLWALGDDDTRVEVAAAHDAAVVATLGWLEKHGNLTRRGKDGIDQVDANGLCVALFRQHTSRALDPQLHTHAVIWTKVQDATGTWLALDANFLVGQQYTMSWLYDAHLRAELTKRLGVGWNPIEPGHGQADIVGIPAWLLEVFSQRAAQVAGKLRELIGRWRADHDGAEPDARDLYVLERRAAVTSRPGKTHDLDPSALRHEWIDRARAAGHDPATLSGAHAHQPGPTVDRETLVYEALRRVSESSSTWIEADLAREVVGQLLPDAVAPADLLAFADELAAEAAGLCTALHPPVAGSRTRRDGRPTTEHVTRRLLTTGPVLDQERRLLDWATASVEPHAPADGQDRQRAVADAIGGIGRLVLVVGPAGAGKTTATRAGVDQLRDQGRSVIGVAPSGKAADVLARESGCPATTLAKLLHTANHHRRLPQPGTTVLLDEAGMASTDDLDQLVRLAQQHQWRIVAIGDPEQLASVGRGGMFAHWTDTLPAHHLDHVHRFTEPWQAQASLALRRGDPTAAAAYVEHGRVRTAHPALATDQAARTHETVTSRGETVAITTSSAATARAINEEIQWHQPSGQPPGPTVQLADGTCARIGDRIATRSNHPWLTTDTGAPVRNRQTWTVTAIHPNGALDVVDDTAGSVRLPGDYVAEHIELGWAVTGYGNQGITTDHAICIIEPGMTRAGIYVGLTRGRGTNTAIILDPSNTADPEDALAGAIARPANATTAHAARDHLYETHGLQPPAPTPATPAAGIDADAERMRQLLAAHAVSVRAEPGRAIGR